MLPVMSNLTLAKLIVSPGTKPLIVFVGMLSPVAPSIRSPPTTLPNVIAPLTMLPTPSSALPPLISSLMAVPPEETNSLPPLLMVVPLSIPPDLTLS